MLVTIGMNEALVGPSSHFELSGVFELSDLELCKVYCIWFSWLCTKIIKMYNENNEPTKILLWSLLLNKMEENEPTKILIYKGYMYFLI